MENKLPGIQYIFLVAWKSLRFVIFMAAPMLLRYGNPIIITILL